MWILQFHLRMVDKKDLNIKELQMLNIAYFRADTEPPFIGFFGVYRVAYVEDPYTMIPPGGQRIPFLDFCNNYPVHMGPNVFWRDGNNAGDGVIDADGNPCFLVGDFYQIEGQNA
jgi:hypothetical protein